MNLLVLFLPVWVLSISLSSPILHAASSISVSQNAQAESPGTIPTAHMLTFNIFLSVSARSVPGTAFYELALVLHYKILNLKPQNTQPHCTVSTSYFLSS